MCRPTWPRPACRWPPPAPGGCQRPTWAWAAAGPAGGCGSGWPRARPRQAAGVALGAAVPATRRWFLDERATTGGAGHALYHTLVRIPLGTAVAEETLFRGALLGILLQRHSRARASAVSAALFGLWHVLPTLDTLALNPLGSAVGGDPVRTTGAVMASVAATAAAGLGFSWLRFRGDSVLAPVVAHAALNCSAFAAARLVARPPRR
jgi:uncharacterized protein